MNENRERWSKNESVGEKSFGVYLLKRGNDRKVGLTSRPYYRFVNRQAKLGWRLLDFVYPMPEWLARQLEKLALKHLDIIGVARGAAKWPNRFEGYTETWDSRDFEVSQVHEIFREKALSGSESSSCSVDFEFQGNSYELTLTGKSLPIEDLKKSASLLMFHDRWQLSIRK